MTDAIHWLISDVAAPWLVLAAENIPATPSFVMRLRRELSAEQASLVCQLAELRLRARKKFTLADRMFFTPVGLEQATDEEIATYKATMFAPYSRVADLCCGIGGDLIALAKQTDVVGIDNDATSATYADMNMSVHGHAPDQVHCHDVHGESLTEYDAWHIDPDRRPDNRRTTDIEQQLPSWSDISMMLEINPNAMIKLAPATTPPSGVQERCESEWIGNRRECKQLALRFGKLARHPGRRVATIIGGQASTVIETDAKDSRSIRHRNDVGAYLYEAHPTLLAASIVPSIAAPIRLESFALIRPAEGAAWGFLTHDEKLPATGFTRFRVLESVPFDKKQIIATARQNDWNVQEIKKRGVQESPTQIRAWFSPSDGEPMTLIVAPTTQGVRALFAVRDDLPP